MTEQRDIVTGRGLLLRLADLEAQSRAAVHSCSYEMVAREDNATLTLKVVAFQGDGLYSAFHASGLPSTGFDATDLGQLPDEELEAYVVTTERAALALMERVGVARRVLLERGKRAK